ncbi:MAG TPA: hypothetical protein VFB58_11975 [Chloroflexota bacterium]|nr:hypothetical protein [Chloroflexota bacterium]
MIPPDLIARAARERQWELQRHGERAFLLQEAMPARRRRGVPVPSISIALAGHIVRAMRDAQQVPGRLGGLATRTLVR